MKKFALTAIALGISGLANAQSTVSICDCQSGADPGCTAGDDTTGNGSMATPYKTLTKPTYNSYAAGSQVQLCIGGSWAPTGAVVIANFNVTAAQPLTITSYQAGWGGTSKPLITTSNNSNNVFTFSDGGTDANDGGYTVSYLRMKGQAYSMQFTASVGGATSGTLVRAVPDGSYSMVFNDGAHTAKTVTITGGTSASWTGALPAGTILRASDTASQYGIQTYNYVRNLTVDSVDFSNFYSGVVVGQVDTSHPATNTWVKNSTFTDIGGDGVITEGFGALIEGNTFTRSAVSSNTNLGDKHAVYLSGYGYLPGSPPGTPPSGGNFDGENIRNNTFIDTCSSAGLAGSNPIVVHGQRNQVTIENNTITDSSTPFDTSGCYGISVKPGYTSAWTEIGKHVTVRGNTVQGFSGIGICMESTPNGIVENNAITDTNGLMTVGVSMACSAADKTATSYDIDGAKVRGNTVYFASTNVSGSVGFAWRNDSSANHVFTDNLVYYGSSAVSTRYCYSPGFASSGFLDWSNNLCYFASATGTHQWSSGNATAPAGFQTGDILGSDPLLTVPTSGNSYAPTISSSGSPAKGAGNATNGPRLDRAFRTRLAPPSIGAYDYGNSSTTVPPSEPFFLR